MVPDEPSINGEPPKGHLIGLKQNGHAMHWTRFHRTTALWIVVSIGVTFIGAMTTVSPVVAVLCSIMLTTFCILVVMSRGFRDMLPVFYAFAAVGIFLFSTGGTSILSRSPEATSGPLGLQVAYVSVYVIAAAFIVFVGIPGAFVASISLLLLVSVSVMPLLSIFWSVNPALTISRSLALLGSTLFAVFFATFFSLQQQRFLLVRCVLFLAVGSLAVAIAFPSVGVSDGGWIGLFTHKNTLGRFAALGISVFAIDLVSPNRSAKASSYGILICIPLLFLSQSATALLSCISLIIALLLIRSIRLHRSLAVPLVIMIVATFVIILYFAIHDSSSILALLGKDPTLTGRTMLWDMVINAIHEKRLFGYGFGAFWEGPLGPSAAIWDALGWGPNQSHMGYLDLILNIGYIGIALFVLLFVSVLGQALIRSRFDEVFQGYVTVFFMIFLAINNITESVVLGQNSLYWILFVVMVLNLNFERVSKSNYH